MAEQIIQKKAPSVTSREGGGVVLVTSKNDKKNVSELKKNVAHLPRIIQRHDHMVNTNCTQTGHIPILHGKATDNIAYIVGGKILINKISNTAIVENGMLKLVINELKGTLGVSTHKLLSVAIAKFTEQNHIGAKERNLRYTVVCIPLKEYAVLCGYDIIPRNDTEAEAKRAENALKEARKKINKDLNILFHAYLSWTENIKRKTQNYIDIRIIESKGIRNGQIEIRFSQTFAEYLVTLPMTQYPLSLLRLDERNRNAYIMGVKFATHYNMDNNQIRDTAQSLKVKTLLQVTTLPDIENESVKKHGWIERIKEPFEHSLDILTACNFIENWEYTHSNGQSMTDAEANFSNYEKWANTNIHFTLHNAPTHQERLKAKENEKEKKKTTKSKKTK